jgi:multiple sugar transport system permease protein
MATTVAEPMHRKRQLTGYSLWSGGLRPLLVYGLLTVLAVIFLFPFYLIVRNALMLQPEITSNSWKWFSSAPHWDNFTQLFADREVPFLLGLRNSAITATVQLVGQLFIASMAGYGLARIPFRGRNVVFYMILIALMIPSAVTFIPTFMMTSYLGMVNTLQGIIIPGLFSVFATFIFRQFYLDFPKELEDAGRVDGLGYWGVYRRIILPNSQGVFVALGVILFISGWNAFLWPFIVGQSKETYTVQVVLSSFLSAQTINLPALFMGAAVAIAPLVILFFIFQRYIVQGVKFSGIKG